MSNHATGAFDVKITPVAGTPDPALGQMSIEKTFHGDLEGTSRGIMLTAGNPATGSAGYVAIEIVTGTLQGRTGAFALMHDATMTPEERALNVIVVPGSATGMLEGLAGKMNIRIEGGKHYYDFDYSLPAKAD